MPGSWPEDGEGVFFDLFGYLEILVIHPQVFIFALFGRVIPADVRPCFVCHAAVVLAEQLALVMDEQEPGIALDEHGRPFVEQKPADKLELAPVLRRVDREREITATLARAVRTKHFAGR